MKKILNSQFSILNSEQGQIILILILVMTVALAIGISVIQRSISDVSTASKVEQSSRAFSAAEAAIENTLATGTLNVDRSLPNDALGYTEASDWLPPAAAGNRQAALEFLPLSKEETAQVWLADPNSNVKLPECTAKDPLGHFPVCYKQNSLDVYWGNSENDRAALELTMVYYDGSKYASRKWFLDQSGVTRNPPNNFILVDACSGYVIGTNKYQCQYTIGGVGDLLGGLPTGLMLIRARLLYNSSSQPLAVQAVNVCNPGCSLPEQERIITSRGTAGTTQRKVMLQQNTKVAPPYLDYAIFSAGDINK